MKKIALFLLIVLLFSPACLIVNADNWGDPDVFYIYSLGPNSFPTDIVKENWEEIERKWPNSILFDLTLFSGSIKMGKDFEVSEYFIESEDVNAIKFYILNINEQTNLSKVKLTIIDPDNTIYCDITLLENLSKNDEFIIKSLDNNSFTFDKTGLWKFRLDFETNITSLIWRHIGNHIFKTFKLTKYPSEELEELTFLNFYSEEIPVITLSDALQVSNIDTMKQQSDTMKQQSDYLNKSASLQEESLKQQKDLTTATLILAVFTACVAATSFFGAISTWKLVTETRRGRKRKHIIKMIKEVIDTCISEFEELKTRIQDINQNKITSLPGHIYSKYLGRNSWIDFGRECPDEFEKIKDYLETKEVYEIIRGELLEEVEQCARNLFKSTRGIRTSLGILNAKRRLSTQGVDVVFDEYISKELAESILREDEEYGNKHVKKIFRRYRGIWIGIKQSPSVAEKITLLQEIAKKMELYAELEEGLKYIKNKFMNDYVITLDQIKAVSLR